MVEPKRLGRVPKLDGLRGVAVLLVLLYHTQALANVFTSKITTVPEFGWVNAIATGSFLGVDIFFVLSGFLITALLLREHDDVSTLNLGGFYRRRAFRLLPPLIVMLVAEGIWSAFAPSYAHLSLRNEATSVAAALTYVFNYATVVHPSWVVPDLGHLWSLAVEEQFYLVWPATLLLVLRWRPKAVPAVLVGGIVAVMINRALLYHHSQSVYIYIRTDARADELLVGATLAWVWTRRLVPPSWDLKALGWLGAVVVVGMVATARTVSPQLYYGGFTVFALAVAFVILAVVETGWGAVLAWRPLRIIGMVSYGLYLWHVPIFAAIQENGGPRWVVARVALGWALSAVATALSWVLIERPAMRFGRARGPRPESGALTGG